MSEQSEPLYRAPLIAVDAAGYCWRVLPGENWSMCPVNPDNSPIPRPLTFYAPVEMTEEQARAMVNATSERAKGMSTDAERLIRELEIAAEALVRAALNDEGQRTLAKLMREAAAALAAATEKLKRAEADAEWQYEMGKQWRLRALEAEKSLAAAAAERNLALGLLPKFERWQYDNRRAALASRVPQTPKFPEGDPDEVRPADSRAESQSELNGPSGSPTSPSGRASRVPQPDPKAAE